MSYLDPTVVSSLSLLVFVLKDVKRGLIALRFLSVRFIPSNLVFKTAPLPFKHRWQKLFSIQFNVPFIPFEYFLKISITLATTRCKIKSRNFIFFSSSPNKQFQVFLCLNNTPHVSFFSCFWQHPECVLLIFSLLIITKKCVPYVWFR